VRCKCSAAVKLDRKVNHVKTKISWWRVSQVWSCRQCTRETGKLWLIPTSVSDNARVPDIPNEKWKETVKWVGASMWGSWEDPTTSQWEGLHTTWSAQITRLWTLLWMASNKSCGSANGVLSSMTLSNDNEGVLRLERKMAQSGESASISKVSRACRTNGCLMPWKSSKSDSTLHRTTTFSCGIEDNASRSELSDSFTPWPSEVSNIRSSRRLWKQTWRASHEKLQHVNWRLCRWGASNLKTTLGTCIVPVSYPGFRTYPIVGYMD